MPVHRLRGDIDVVDFLNTISGACKGEVWFDTDQGDAIELKSELSRYVFLTMCEQDGFLRMGTLTFAEPRDAEALKRFLV